MVLGLVVELVVELVLEWVVPQLVLALVEGLVLEVSCLRAKAWELVVEVVVREAELEVVLMAPEVLVGVLE